MAIEKQLTRDGVKTILTPFVFKIVAAVLFFLSAGRWDLYRAWLFFGVDFTGLLVISIVFWKLAPELANERSTIKEGAKPWDKIFLAFFFFVSVFLFTIVAGLDVGRYRWSMLPISYAIIGIFLYIISIILGCWALVVNKFFELAVRIQKDRGHKVITDGPYRYIRHPGYLSMILGFLAASFIIGSAWSLIPGGLVIIAVLVRTHLEDRTLQEELDGYLEYASRVRWRLLPGIW